MTKKEETILHPPSQDRYNKTVYKLSNNEISSSSRRGLVSICSKVEGGRSKVVVDKVEKLKGRNLLVEKAER